MSSRLTLEERFWGRCEVRDYGCIEWQGGTDPDGYGAIKYEGRKINTHVLSYMLANGSIPKGMCVCHVCDNRICVNPDHLWLGTKKDNHRDMVEKDRHFDVNHRKRGFEITEGR